MTCACLLMCTPTNGQGKCISLSSVGPGFFQIALCDATGEQEAFVSVTSACLRPARNLVFMPIGALSWWWLYMYDSAKVYVQA